jgi:branched-chain amino acid transport system permease protein
MIRSSGRWLVSGVSLSGTSVFAVGVAFVLLAAYYVFANRSMIGKALRACSEDPVGAALLGIPTSLVVSVAWLIGSGLAGVGGALFETFIPVAPTEGSLLIVKAFTVALIGGIGSTRGIVFAAFILAGVETFLPGALIPAAWTPAFAFVMIILILAIRPQGLFRGYEGSSVV